MDDGRKKHIRYRSREKGTQFLVESVGVGAGRPFFACCVDFC